MDSIEKAAIFLRDGGVGAIPTETVYGLAGAYDDLTAVRRVFEVKGRPASHPLIVHVLDTEMASHVAEVDERAHKLMKRFWPGPLSLVLPKRESTPTAVTGGQDSVAVRAPDHIVARQVIEALGKPVVAPSANLFGQVSPTSAAHVALELGDTIDFILDGGPCRVGVESTVLDLRPGNLAILRPGLVTAEHLSQSLNVPLGTIGTQSDAAAPGTLPHHYAPRAKVIVAIVADLPSILERNELERPVLLAPQSFEGMPHLPLPHDPKQAAQRLYAAFREADQAGYLEIVVVLPDASGIGQAVRDRVLRASAATTTQMPLE